MKNSRRLKIYKKYQRRAYYRGITVPEIILRGQWLDKLGFKEGEMVTIKEEKNKLTISLDRGRNN